MKSIFLYNVAFSSLSLIDQLIFQNFAYNVLLIVTSLIVFVLVPVALLLVWFIFHHAYKKIIRDKK